MAMADPLHAVTLGDVLREHGRSWPGQTAVVDGAVRLTYRELDGGVNRLAHALREAGVGPGDRVLWLGQNSYRILEALLAAAKLGAMLCPANWRQTAAELAFVIDDLEPAVVIWQDAEIGEAVRKARAQTGDRGRWVRHDDDGAESYAAFVDDAPAEDPVVAVDPGASLVLMYTAAFGGRPNAAMLSHAALVTQGLLLSRLAGIDSEYRYLNCGPLFHIATLMTTVATFVSAGTNVFTPRVDAEELCRLIEVERCTGAFLVGPTIEQILDFNREQRYALRSLRSFAGTPRWNDMITVDRSPWARNPGGYGQTEVTGLLTFNALAAGAVGGHGRASPLAQVRVVDPGGRDVPDGDVGEIVARGPIVMNGYWNRPEESERRLRDGWHHTNDLGRRESDGTITFIGPRTRLVKSGAENIYPAEVEQCVTAHPAVAECAVIGVPDPRWTQSVLAVVALRENATATAAEIVEHCRARIASYKKPRRVEFVDRLPRTADGQVDREALDERFGGGGYPGEGGHPA